MDSIETTTDTRHHGAFGIVSFSLALVAAVIALLAYQMAAYLAAIQLINQLNAAIIGSVFCICWFMDALAIGLGIAGTRDKTTKPVLSTIGIAVAAATILLSGILVAKGFAA